MKKSNYLKSFFFLLFASIIIGCDNFSFVRDTNSDNPTYQFNVSSFPYDAAGMEVTVDFYRGTNFINSRTLGTVPSDLSMISSDASTSHRADNFFVYLKSNDTKKYYIPVQIDDTTFDVNGYWWYAEGNAPSNCICATSKDYITELPLDKTIHLDFQNEPFHIYSFKAEGTCLLKLKYSNKENTDLYLTTDINLILQNSLSSIEESLFFSMKEYEFTDCTVYFYFKPEYISRYQNWTQTGIDILFHDYTTELEYSGEIYTSCMGSDNNIYLSASHENYHEYTGNKKLSRFTAKHNFYMYCY